AAIDVTRARTQLVTAQGLTIIARNELDRARIALARALAIDPATPLELADTLAAGRANAEVPGDRQAAVAAALAGRPDLQAEVARGAAARQTGSAIRAERLPRLDLEADYGVNGLTMPSAISTRQVALQVTVPILDGFHREARIAEQNATVSESRVRERDLRQQIAADVEAALLDLRSSEAQQIVAAERLRLATDELAQARERFKAGVAGNIEVIDAQSNLIRARDTDIDARFAAASARVAPARAVGVAAALHQPSIPKVGGFVTLVRTDENRQVQAGDTLVVLDDRDYRARLAQAEADLAVALAGVSNKARVGQAEAQVAQAEANAKKAHADLDRLLPLAQQDIASKQQLDAAQAAAAAADAALAAAQAALAGADARVAAARAVRDQGALNLSYTRITAPSAGVVSKKSVEVGQLVQPGQPLMSVVPLEDVWITANLKETEVQDVKPGDHVDFTVDAYPGARFTGRVESLSPATGARFSLLPPDNATGNFTKVVKGLPVRIRLEQRDPAHPLRPGMSVVVTITTK